MNLALVTSYIIAAMLILSIIMMNLRLTNSSAELVLTQITRQHAVNVADMLNDDIANMGYHVDTKTDQILRCAQEHRIRFYRNLEFDDPNREPEDITWELLNEEVPETKNPNHRVLLRRVVDQNTGAVDSLKIKTGVTNLRFQYYENHGDDIPISQPGCTYPTNIKQIRLELEMQSAEPLYNRGNSDGRYIRSVYEKRYSPRNLD